MDQLDAMRAFVRVAELESFTRCAEQTGIPRRPSLPPSVGWRSAWGPGSCCVPRGGCSSPRTASSAMPDAGSFWRTWRSLTACFARGQISGQLRVDMPSRMARHLVIPALPDFLAQHPALQLMLSSTDRRVDLVREGFDCVVRVGALEPSSLVARPLGHYRQINCASAGYLARHGVPRTLGDLAGHRLVHYGSGFGAGQGRSEPGFEYLAEDGHRALLPMAGPLMVNDSETYLAAALAGLGIIQMPRVGSNPLLAGASW